MTISIKSAVQTSWRASL